MTVNIYECIKCGACCNYFHNIPILPEEVSLIDKNLKQYTMISPLQTKNGLSMKFVEGTKRCIALEGQIGQSVKCSVYDIRPPVCRKFEPGSDLCKKARLEVLGIVG